MGDARQAEFLAGTFVVALAGDQPARNQQQDGAFLQAYGGSIGGGVRKESERQASRTQLSDPVAVAEKSGSVSGVGVTKCAELLVVAGDEGRGGDDAARSFDEAAIDAKTQ